jgi:hypothetical protein
MSVRYPVSDLLMIKTVRVFTNIIEMVVFKYQKLSTYSMKIMFCALFVLTA